MPRSYASTAYAALWVAALAGNQTKESSSIEQVKGVFTRIANSYNGITGNVSLDQNGDRRYGDYEYWAVTEDRNNSASHVWKPIGRFVYENKDQSTGK